MCAKLTEALLCRDGPVKSLVAPFLAPDHRRGHGGMYGDLNRGHVEVVHRLNVGHRTRPAKLVDVVPIVTLIDVDVPRVVQRLPIICLARLPASGDNVST